MSKTVKLSDIPQAIGQELTIYHEETVNKLNEAGQKAIKRLAKLTKNTAPVGERGSYKRNIASKVLKKSPRGNTYVWYVKAPDHRLTHLLVHGHATKDGGRTKADPFLHKALDTVLPEYERDAEEAVK